MPPARVATTGTPARSASWSTSGWPSHRLGRTNTVAAASSAGTSARCPRNSASMPSLWDGQPLVLQEALRAGVPVVATRAGGIPDLTGDDAAVLVPPGDAARLAAAVRGVLGDPALAARLRAAARERGAELPSPDDAVAAALTCYAEALRAP